MNLSSLGKYLAIEPTRLGELQSLNLKDGIPLSQTRTVSVRDGIAIIPLYGVITARYDLLTYMMGGTALDILAKDIQQALENPSIKTIVLDIDSPGGVAVGPAEMSEFINTAIKNKDIIAYVGRNCCSAAYWIASSCSKIVAHESAIIGSIGVVTTLPVQEHPDQNGYMNIEILSSNAKNKRPNPKTPEGLEEIKKELDALEMKFMSDISKYRHISVDKIKTDFGAGGVFMGSKAKEKGMVDNLNSFEGLLKDLTTKEKDNKMTEKAETFSLQEVEKMKTEAFEKGRAEGIKQENARINALESIDTLGYDELLKQAKANPEMTAEKLSLQILSKEKEEGGRYLNQLRSNETKLPKVSAVMEENTQKLTIEEQAKSNWNKDKNLQAEFASFDDYFAYMKANDEGLIQLYSNKGGKND